MRVSRWLPSVAIWAACVLCQVVAVRGFWLYERPEPGQVMRGLFEDRDGRPAIVFQPCCGEEFYEAPGLGAQGEISLSSGMTAGVALESGGRYVVAAERGTGVPYVVFGSLRDTDGVPYLADARRMAVREGRLQLVDWDSAAPWPEDAAWLGTLRDQCAPTGAQTVPLIAVVDEQGISIEVGRCHVSDVVDRSAKDQPVMAVLSGPAWARIERQPSGFRTQLAVIRIALIAVLVCSNILLAALWALGFARGAGPMSAALVALGFLRPAVALLAFFVLAAVAGLAGVVWLVDRVLPIGRRSIRSSIAALAAGLIIVVVLRLAAQHMDETGRVERPWAPSAASPAGTSARAACGLIGYSAVADDAQLRAGGGVSQMLARCPACAAGLLVASRHGGTVDWMRKQVCAVDLAPGAPIVFFGGANDDMLWAHDRRGFWGDVGALLPFYAAVHERRLQLDQQSRLLDQLSASSLRAGDEQAAEIAAAVRCAADRGHPFVFVHDLLITDLTGGRSPNRQALLERRQAAVGAEGRHAVFIDPLAAFGSEIGVSWFNDIRHPSLVGHRKIAEQMCAVLETLQAR